MVEISDDALRVFAKAISVDSKIDHECNLGDLIEILFIKLCSSEKSFGKIKLNKLIRVKVNYVENLLNLAYRNYTIIQGKSGTRFFVSFGQTFGLDPTTVLYACPIVNKNVFESIEKLGDTHVQGVATLLFVRRGGVFTNSRFEIKNNLEFLVRSINNSSQVKIQAKVLMVDVDELLRKILDALN